MLVQMKAVRHSAAIQVVQVWALLNDLQPLSGSQSSKVLAP